MSFWKIAGGVATGILVAFVLIHVPALWDSLQREQRVKAEVAAHLGREALKERQLEQRKIHVRKECGDSDRCSVAYWHAIHEWDACRELHVTPPSSCVTEFDAATSAAKASIDVKTIR